MEDNENQTKKGLFKNQLTAKLGSWFTQAKEKYQGELANPESKLNTMKNSLAKMNDDLKNSQVSQNFDRIVTQTMVGLKLEQPL